MPNLNTIVGKFGSGKTSTAVHLMLLHMSRGGVVASNINLRGEPFISLIYQSAQAGFIHALKVLYNWDYREGQFIYLPDTELIVIESSSGKPRRIPKAARFWEHVPAGKPDLHVLVFIDEAHKVWPKDSYSFMPTGDTDIISVMRHLNIELFWMTQHEEHVWVDLRRLTEDWFYVNNLKKGGMGIVGRFPLIMRVPVQFIGWVFRFLLRPVLGRCPDIIRVRRFRSQEESKEFLYAGYPKYERYSPLVLQSYDSPKAVSMIQMDSEAENDFRPVVPVVKPSSKFKKLVPAFLFGASFIVLCFSFSSGCRSPRHSVPASGSASVPVVPPVPVSARSVPVPLPVKPLVYLWASDVNGFCSVCLASGEVFRTGDVFDGALSVVRFSEDRLFLSDGSFRRLVKSVSSSAFSSNVSRAASSSGSSLLSGLGLSGKPL